MTTNWPLGSTPYNPLAATMAFGYRPALPLWATAAWGARWIVHKSGIVDFVYDRQSLVGDYTELQKWLNGGAIKKAIDNTVKLLKSGEMQVSEDTQFTLYADSYGTIIGNPNRSYGYLYVIAYPNKAAQA